MTPDITATMLLGDVALPPITIPEKLPSDASRRVVELLATRCPYRTLQAVGLIEKHRVGYAKRWGANLDEGTLVLLEQCTMRQHLEVTNAFLAMRNNATRREMHQLYADCELCQAALRALIALRPNGAGQHLATSVDRLTDALDAIIAERT